MLRPGSGVELGAAAVSPRVWGETAMPVAVSYPGVYVQTLITQAPTDQGVATSITAFVGRAFMGPVNTATQISCFADFQRLFGGLSADYPLSYAVNDFYNNGGGAAIIVRLYAPLFSTPAVLEEAQAVVNDLQAVVSKAASGADAVKALTAEIAKQSKDGGLFNPYQQGIANQIQQNFQGLSTSTLTGDALLAQENAVYAMSVRTTQASLAINLVNTVQSAASALYGAALAAAAGAPDTPSTVMTAINRTVTQLAATAPPAAVTFLNGVAAAVNAQAAKAPSSGGGTFLALQTAAAAPTAAQTALNLTSDPTLKAVNTDFLAVQPVIKAAMTAAAAAGATAAKVQTAVTTAAKSLTGTAGTAAGFLVTAAGAAITNGADANGVAAATALGVLAAIANDWPNTLNLTAADPGEWGNDLTATVDFNGQIPGSGLFNLTVSYLTPTGLTTIEQFRSVTTDVTQPNANRLDVVLQTSSNFLRVPLNSDGTPDMPFITPDAQGSGSGSGGSDSNALAITDYLGDQSQKTGMYALEQVPIFNILCIPPDQAGGDTQPYVYQVAAEYCASRWAMLILDPPGQWYQDYLQGNVAGIGLSSLGSFSAPAARSAAIYFPRMVAVDPLQNGQQAVFPACGAIAGVWAATDTSRGVWKAPAGLQASLNAIVGLQVNLTNAECGLLNPQGINCLRTFSAGGTVVWGARTLQGADALEDEYKYVPVQRTLLYIANSLLVNTQWAVFEPNDEPLWAELRLSVGVFMANLFRQGAFQGQTADQAYFVKCDSTTTTQADIDAGVVNVQVGFAPLKPAEFVVITIQQIAGQG